MFFVDRFPKILKACGLDYLNITPHALRHTAAMFNLLRGGSLEATRQLMRHETIQSTLVYQEHLERIKDDSEDQIEAFILKEEEEHYLDYIILLS